MRVVWNKRDSEGSSMKPPCLPSNSNPETNASSTQNDVNWWIDAVSNGDSVNAWRCCSSCSVVKKSDTKKIKINENRITIPMIIKMVICALRCEIDFMVKKLSASM